MANVSKLVGLKKKLVDYRLQLEMGLAEYVVLNPKKSYREIGKGVGYTASSICEIAKKYSVNRNAKPSTITDDGAR
jgi:hypothetical protein